MKILASVLLALCGAFGEEAPTRMTELMVKLESPEIPTDSFAAQAKRMYRAGSRYCRIEERPRTRNSWAADYERTGLLVD